ncbi:MAG: prohibitin family protein [bacterium]
MEENRTKILKIVLFIVVLCVLLFDSIGTIGAGERGVKTRFGAIVGNIPQGLYFKIPFVENVNVMDVKTRTINYDKVGDNGDEKATGDNLFGASKDLQDVAIGVVVNYHIDAMKVQEIFSQYSSVDNYEMNVIEPMVREIVKSTAAQYTAEELVTKRAEFSDKVNSLLAEQFTDKSAILERFSVTSFSFSPVFSQAIETKVAAVQNAEAAKNKLEQVKAEAQQTIEKAKAEAEAIRISAQAISSQGGADYVSLKAVEKWNGVLPVSFVPGSALPFLNIK